MKVLITGSNGFIGRNLSIWIKNAGFEILSYDIDATRPLESLVSEADFIFHLAGVNRPLTIEEFYDGNSNLTLKLANIVESQKRNIPICFASSIQASLDNDYGKSKRMAEEYLISFSKKTGNEVFIFRLQNVFGKWCKPNYNSVVATFCYNIANNIPIQIADQQASRDFVYIDDICKTFVLLLNRRENCLDYEYRTISPSYRKTIGEIADLIQSFKLSRSNLQLPDVGDEFVSKLYATYLTYLDPVEGFSYSLNPHLDNRGSFVEILKSSDSGQVSINISKPGITKGNHYHNTKNEKFIVLYGTCVLKFRKVGTDVVYQYLVKGTDLRVIDIPCGYTHSITNVGNEDSITLMWASELFDPNNPDTYFQEV